MPRIPKAFVSYSWDSDDHRTWVRNFGTRLRTDGVDVTLDQWHLFPGDQLTGFMEAAVRDNDFVLIVCTPRYRARSNERAGGVGYESNIMTAEVLNEKNERKFIPLLRSGEWKTSAPSWLMGKLTLDFRGDPYSEAIYEDLLRTMHGAIEQAPSIVVRRDFVKEGPIVKFDEFHGQEHWHSKPCLDFGYSAVGQRIREFATVLPHKQVFSPESLSDCDVLVLPIPYGMLVPENEYEAIARWVHGGGGLLLCGFYFMESHLYTNFNKLAAQLNFRFRTDLLMPVDRDSRDDIIAQAFPVDPRFCVFTSVLPTRSQNPLLNDVRRVAIQSSCSIETYLPQPDLMVETGTKVSVINPVGPRARSRPDYILQVQDYSRQQTTASFLAAYCIGKGRVLAVGSFKLFLDLYIEDGTVDNGRLFDNAVKWLSPSWLKPSR